MAVTRPIRAGAVLAMMVLTILCAMPAFARSTVSSVRLGNHPDGVTRVVMDLSEQVGFTTATIAGPDRIVVTTASDLTWTDESAARRSFGAVRGLSYQTGGGGQGAIIIALKVPALVKSAYMIPPRDGLGWRLVVDVQQTSRAAFLAEAQIPEAAAAPLRPAQPTRAPAPAPSHSPAPAPSHSPGPAPSHSIVLYSPKVAPPEPVMATPPEPVKVTQAEPMKVTDPKVAEPEPVKVAAAPPAPPPEPAPVRMQEPAPVQISQPEPRPAAEAAPADAKHGKTGSSVLSAPVPPPLERPTRPMVAGLPAPAAGAPLRLDDDDASASASATPPMLTRVSASTRAPASRRSPRSEGKVVVVIDPGHGGVDPGATGVSGMYEKHITLAMGRELKKQLERSGRYIVHLTRDRDIFIRLRERVAIARQYGADLFISLHADSVGNPQLKGLSVYTLSQNASDGEAQALAEKENKADLIAGIDLSHESADVANILIDLAQRETMNRSASFATGVVDEVARETHLLENTHRFAGFAVLKAPDVPSILVELGYLSNAGEERQLRQPEYRTTLARAISRAVDHFFLDGQKARRP